MYLSYLKKISQLFLSVSFNIEWMFAGVKLCGQNLLYRYYSFAVCLSVQDYLSFLRFKLHQQLTSVLTLINTNIEKVGFC